MTGFAATPREARSAFVSYYPFELVNGGLGILLNATTTSGSTRVALVGEGPQALITNPGNVAASLFFGGSSDVATTACQLILPGIPYTLGIPPTATHAMCITAAGSTTIQITRGYGN
jgi:hypothetical protein